MSKGPTSDAAPREGYTPFTIRNLVGTVTDIVTNSADSTGHPVAVNTIICENTSAATAFVQFFATAKDKVTLGTTRPDFEVPVAATTGFVAVSFPAAGAGFPNGLSTASTTATEGSSASASGVRVTAFTR